MANANQTVHKTHPCTAVPTWEKLFIKIRDIALKLQKTNTMKFPNPPTQVTEHVSTCDPSLLRTRTLLKQPYDVFTEPAIPEFSFEDSMETTMKLLAQKIEGALREAKSKHLKCGEILVPSNLTMKIAHLVLRMSENEPCGVRGCVIYLNLEEKNKCRRIGSIKCDPFTVATFELHLTLKQDSSWLRHLLPSRWIKSFGRTSAFVVSEAYTMTKKKLYRSSTLN